MGQGPGLFCKKLINDSQLQNLFMIFLLGRGNSWGRGQQGGGRKRPTDKLAMEILGWML